MRYFEITLDQAVLLEDQGLLEIYYPGGLNNRFDFDPSVDFWIDNFKKKSYEFRQIDLEDLLEFLDVEYRISVLVEEDKESRSYTWTYLYGRLTDKGRKKEIPKGKYVYILTNPAYPHLVKVGKAVNPLSRIKGINGAGVISEWVLRFALPVTSDYKVEHLMHERFQEHRRNSDQGSSREFFEVDYEDAVRALKEYGETFGTGDPYDFDKLS